MESPTPSQAPDPNSSFLGRHEFLLRRFHSLSGLIPVGAYMVVHLLVNSSILSGPSVFQKNVYQIHSLEDVLVVVEWAFIFIPILFHAIFGVVIICGGVPNTKHYPYARNIRYTLQRATGMIAFAFIMWHVFHLHGWFHFEAWQEHVAKPFGGANFKPYNAASTLAAAMSSTLVQALYAIGMLSCVYHLANGIWTMGITWGLWISPAAQKRADRVCIVGGLLLAVVGLGSIKGAAEVDIDGARTIEKQMYDARVESGDVKPNLHKRAETGGRPQGE